MNKDITFCKNSHCIHRRGCKRWVGNYRSLPTHFSVLTNPEKSCEYNEEQFRMMLRFRNSNIEGFID